jgi:hypothetical protein
MGDTMSEHQLFLSERDKIDVLIQKGYRISNIIENLNGSYVEFVHPTKTESETLHISTANGRKYFSSIFIKQNSSSYIKKG